MFIIGGKFCPVSNFTELHALPLAAHSYALLSGKPGPCHATINHLTSITSAKDPARTSPEPKSLLFFSVQILPTLLTAHTLAQMKYLSDHDMCLFLVLCGCTCDTRVCIFLMAVRWLLFLVSSKYFRAFNQLRKDEVRSQVQAVLQLKTSTKALARLHKQVHDMMRNIAESLQLWSRNLVLQENDINPPGVCSFYPSASFLVTSFIPQFLFSLLISNV